MPPGSLATAHWSLMAFLRKASVFAGYAAERGLLSAAALLFALALGLAFAPAVAAQSAQASAAKSTGSDALPAASPFNSAWTAIGPQPTLPGASGIFGNTSGRVTAIAVDPTDATGDTVFIGAAEGGVWKTTNGGATWLPLTDAQDSLAIGALAIAIDPSNNLDANHRVIYAGTGEQSIGADQYYGAGVLKSLDGGTTWTEACSGTAFTNASCPFIGPFSNGFIPGGGARIGSLAVNPANPNLLLAGVEIYTSSGIGGQIAQPGIYCTNNAGAAWSRISPAGLTTTAMASTVFFTSSSTAYAAIEQSEGDSTNGIYVSHNASAACGAQTWTRVSGAGLPPQSSMGQIALAAASGNASVLYAAVANANTGSQTILGVFRSADGGNTWSQLTAIPDFCANQCWYDMVIGVDPGDATGNTVLFGGGEYSDPAGTTLLRTTDGGATFGDVSAAGGGTKLQAGQHAIGFTADGVTVYVGNDGGLWSSSSAANSTVEAGAQTWNNLNGDLSLTQFNPGLAIHPSTPAIAFAGAQSNGAQAYQAVANPSTWTNTNTCDDGAYSVIDPNEQTSVYLSCGGLAGQPAIYKSIQSGQQGTFSLLASSSTIGAGSPRDPIGIFPPLVVDPQLAEHLYYGTYRLFETTNGGASWSAASGDLTSGGISDGFVLTSIAFAPLAGGGYNLYSGADDGTVEMAANATAGSNVAARHVSSGLPARAVTRVIADPSDSTGNTAYVAFSGFAVDQSISGGSVDLQGHIFRTTNGGTSWSDVSCHASDCAAPLATDLPNFPVNDVAIDPDDPSHQTLYAATDFGIYVTANGGASWATLGTGLPNVVVSSLALHEPSRTLRAATHGRGAWDYPLPALAGTSGFALTSLSVSSAPAGSEAALALTIDGRGFTSQSTVLWNGSSQGITLTGTPTATTISASVAASDLAQAGVISVQVSDPTHSPSTTNALPFDITATAPTLASVSPSSTNVSNSALAITVSGTNFVKSATLAQSSAVTVNDGSTGVSTTQVTTTGSPQTISATLASSLLQYGGEYFIGVTNPAPGGGSASPELLFTVNSAGPPANDNVGSAATVTTGLYTATVDNFAATSEATDPAPSCATGSSNPTGKSVWWIYTAGSAGVVTASTIGSAYDTVLDVFTGAPGNFTEVSSGCNNNISSANLQSQVTFGTIAGSTYYFMVTVFDTGKCPPAGSSVAECGGKTVFNFSGPTPAGVTASPNPATITAGATMTFAINTLAPPLSGQVNLTLSGCPPVATCTFLSSSVTAGTSTVLTVVTSPNSSVLTPVSRRFAPPAGWVCVAALMLMAALLALSAAAARRKQRRFAAQAACAVLLFVAAGAAIGCGSSSGTNGTGVLIGTAPGVYPLVITGTGNGNTSSTTTLNITVQ